MWLPAVSVMAVRLPKSVKTSKVFGNLGGLKPANASVHASGYAVSFSFIGDLTDLLQYRVWQNREAKSHPT